MLPPHLRSINGHIAKDIELRNRTNNPIESYNRRAKQVYDSYPTFVVFVEKAKREAERFLLLMDDIAMHHRRA
ncbi:hypothetical protein PHPALM_27814 [Phytophthora palmivora]|uniref:Uncharacterized protein n=1 Tax=Phytophthora palmivora TaxID=4796 RepID=A0A2P4XBQ6_9STRA|nr:hypothetical protein PHPALM_27814 [Phytophthora palmivora]